MSHTTRIIQRTPWIGVLTLAICLAGCGKPEPIIGLKFPELPPTTVVEGPGFTIDLWENWTARTEGTKLIFSTPDQKDATIGVIELQPYAAGEDSDNVLDRVETARIAMKLPNAIHRRVNFKGLPAYCSRYARLKKNQAFDATYYVVATPAGKIVATVESATQPLYMRDVVMCEKIVASVKLK